MKSRNNLKRVWLLGMATLCTLAVFAQITTEKMQQFVTQDKQTVASDKIKEFYKLYKYNTAWINRENAGNLNVLFTEITKAPYLALNAKDYAYTYLAAIQNGQENLKNTEDSLEAEIRITDAALHFYGDIVYGNTKPAFGYNGLKYTPDCLNIPALLAAYITLNKLPSLASAISPTILEVSVIENKIKQLLTVMAQNNFAEQTITSNKINANNSALITKLYQLGIINETEKSLPDNTLKQKLKEAQKQFGLLADGVLRTTILKELNVPVAVRLKQLMLALNYYRWLNCVTQNQSVIVVNLPAAYLKVYKNSKTIFEMRVIVGKKATPTPTLTSKIDEVVLYPYWHVPYKIATKELLPSIKRNPGYINKNNYQVLNSAGNIVNPYSVNWRSLSAGYFPYTIRQSTGCDNALGLLKLNFYNPFSVYLHDTPNKNLFSMNKRFFSHGCMRMEKPMDIGHLVLKNNNIAIDTLEQKGCLRNQSPIFVKADVQMPVIVWYNPVGIDAEKRVIFYEDIYGKFNWMH
ncbi:MAG: L,D-transpeptidase family protein [Chitinophagaceae bacterium]|nr:L,D-transpeptidase family protein [Chitinophagaceae bacterium]